MSCPLRFCRFTSTPAVTPSPGTSGRLKPNAFASFIANSLPLMRAAIESSASRFERSSHGLRLRKTVAPFVALDWLSRSSPTSATMFCTAGSLRMIFSTLMTIASVRCSDAASGS